MAKPTGFVNTSNLPVSFPVPACLLTLVLGVAEGSLPVGAQAIALADRLVESSRMPGYR